ncbi:hypothetical protein FQN60_010951, partial [Etheostoma spectabile]
MDFFYKYGAPKRILTDQGKEFVNKINLDMCAKLGIARSLCAPYHPQTNGLVERLNGTIQGALKKMVRGHPSDWDDYIRPTITDEEVNSLAGNEDVTLTSKLSDVYPKVEANILAAQQRVRKRKPVQPSPLRCPRVPQSPILTQSPQPSLQTPDELIAEIWSGKQQGVLWSKIQCTTCSLWFHW